ncbi:MAG: hypothetical protein OXF61_02525 [Acidimicrobiaceae bacterium]|nr:hypothetical protein [Acidimicrobiaceae bacterium]
MAFYAPTAGSQYSLHIYDKLLELDAIERKDIDDQITEELLDWHGPIWWMDALRLLAALRSSIEDEIVRCISDTRIDYADGERDLDEFEFGQPTWNEIGKCLGVSAQAAQQRYGKLLRAHSVIGEIASVEPPRRLAPDHPAQKRSPALPKSLQQ